MRRFGVVPTLSVGIVLVSLVVAGVIWVAAPFGDSLDPGESRRTYAVANGYGSSATVVTPGGDVEVFVGRPAQRLSDVPPEQVGTSEDLATERGNRLVTVSWSVDLSSYETPLPGADPGLPGSDIELELRADGDDYPLATLEVSRDAEPFGDWTHAVVAVRGEVSAEDVEVAVTYEGVTQTVRGTGEVHTGRAGDLAEPPEVVALERCDTPLPRGFDETDLGCEIDAVRLLPYHPDLGWAEEGTSFAVVDVSVSAFTADRVGPGREFTSLEVADQDVELTLDGAPALPGYDRLVEDSEGLGRGTLVFAVTDPPRSVELRRTVRLRPALSLQTATRSVVLTERLALTAP